ncbi:guanine deaminase [Camelus ferus]|nr:guanine deaminase [Camelus ferus]
MIVFLEEASQQEKLAKEWCFKPCEIRELNHHEFFMPGLVDTHIHAPQYSFAGSNVDLPLLEWLTKYTFPTEHKFQSIDFAEEVYTRVVSHISENRDEIKAVKNLYPSYKNYTDVFDKNNLLTNKTVMAHGCYLSEEELDVFRERGASISHCPNSNLSLSSGLLNVLEVLKHEVKIGLGTALGLDKEIGNFEVGKEFDALLINPKASDSPIDLFYGDFVGDISEAVIQKFLYLGDDRNIEEVYVGGKQVVPFSSSV